MIRIINQLKGGHGRWTGSGIMWNDYRGRIGMSAVLAALITSMVNFLQRDLVFATVLLAVAGVLLLALLWWVQPSDGGSHMSNATAQASAGDAGVIVYWRPGCVFCDRLKIGLGSARHDVLWVNVMRDSEGAELVATLQHGNVLVPTAVTGAGDLIDATPAAIKAQLAVAAGRSKAHWG